jgi:DNA-binding CsgD family transcriptional regulator
MNDSELAVFRPDEMDVSILRKLTAGKSYEEVAASEYVSARTVRRLVAALKRRTGSPTLAALCAEATRRGWLR